jgi:hypothetical protein
MARDSRARAWQVRTPIVPESALFCERFAGMGPNQEMVEEPDATIRRRMPAAEQLPGSASIS